MKIAKIKDVKTPTRGTNGSAGLDFYIPDTFEPVILYPGENLSIASGIKVEVPKGYALIAFNKSGVALKKGLSIGACVVDEDYQGEVHLHVINTSSYTTDLNPGEKLVQFILLPVLYADIEEVDESILFTEESARGTGAFGSTGIQ